MGVREAVNLILACNGANDPKEGADAVEKFRSLKSFPYGIEELEDDEIREIGRQPTLGNALEELVRLTPYLFKTFDENFKLTYPDQSENDRFHIIARIDCVKLENDSATIWVGSAIFHGYDPNLAKKNMLTVMYLKRNEEFNWSDLLKIPAKYRETDVTLSFGIFMGLANLLLEDSLQFPDELVPKARVEAADG